MAALAGFDILCIQALLYICGLYCTNAMDSPSEHCLRSAGLVFCVLFLVLRGFFELSRFQVCKFASFGVIQIFVSSSSSPRINWYIMPMPWISSALHPQFLGICSFLMHCSAQKLLHILYIFASPGVIAASRLPIVPHLLPILSICIQLQCHGNHAECISPTPSHHPGST